MDPQAIARFGVPTRNVLNVVEAVGTKKVGEVREGQRRFPLVVRLPDRQRTDPDALAARSFRRRRAGAAARTGWRRSTETEGPATINREWGKRRITVQCNVRGRDVGSFVAEAQRQDRRAGEAAGRLHASNGAASSRTWSAPTARLLFVVPWRWR